MPYEQNDVLSYFYQEIMSLFSSGILATIYTSREQRIDDFDFSTNSAIVFDCKDGTSTGYCHHNIWMGDKTLRIEATILAKSRDEAHKVLDKLERYLGQGQFQDASLTPPFGPSGYFYTFPGSETRFPVESDVFGLRYEFDILFFKTIYISP